MGLLSDLLPGLFDTPVTAAAVRAEAWALGGRHGGQVAEGARQELARSGVSLGRARLLRAVLRSHQETR